MSRDWTWVLDRVGVEAVLDENLNNIDRELKEARAGGCSELSAYFLGQQVALSRLFTDLQDAGMLVEKSSLNVWDGNGEEPY